MEPLDSWRMNEYSTGTRAVVGVGGTTGQFVRPSVSARACAWRRQRPEPVPMHAQGKKVGRIPVAKPRHALRHDENILFGTDSDQRSATLPLQKWSARSR